MRISLYGLGVAAALLVASLIARSLILKALAASVAEAERQGDAAVVGEKRRVRGMVASVLNAELVVLPVLGYFLGQFAFGP